MPVTIGEGLIGDGYIGDPLVGDVATAGTPGKGSLPTIYCEYSPGTDPVAAPNWVDISSKLRSFKTKRGRQHELDRTEAGTADIILDNRDRTFDGTIHSTIVPCSNIRLRAVWQGTTYYLYRGFVENWGTSTPERFDGIADVRAVDGLGMALGLKKLNTTYPSEDTGARINRVLNDANWSTGQAWDLGDPVSGILGLTTVVGPVGDRAIDTGDTVVQAQTLTNVYALQHVQDMQAAEQGMDFIDGAGNFVWHNRNRRINQTSRVTFGGALGPGSSSGDTTFGSGTFGQGTFGGSSLTTIPAEIPYFEPGDFDLDALRIYNEVEITPIGATTPSVAIDLNSQRRYFTRSMVVTNSPIDDPGGIFSTGLATLLVRMNKDPRTRVPSLTVRPQTDDMMWPWVLGLELDDMVTVHRTPQSQPGGPRQEFVCYIEGIEHEFSFATRTWQTIYRLSAVNTGGVSGGPGTTYWALGDPAYGILGDTTRLSF